MTAIVDETTGRPEVAGNVCRHDGSVMATEKASILQRLFAHVMSFGLCVVLPAGFTCLFPVSSLTFVRSGDAVSATAVRRAFFIIPFLTEEITHVTGVDDARQAGTLSKTTRSGPVNDPKRPETRSENMSWLVIQGRTGEIRVPVSPANIDTVRRRARDFLNDPDQPKLSMWTVANWKISVVIAAFVCMLPLVYAGSIAWDVVSLFRKKPSHSTATP